MHVWAYETDDGSPVCLGEVQAAYSSASLHRGFPANVCILGCKRYTWRLQTLSLTDACICHVGRTYVQERLQVLASEFGPNRLGGCTALQDGLHCTAGRVAVHCVENHSFSPSLTDYVMSSEMRVSSRVHAYVYI